MIADQNQYDRVSQMGTSQKNSIMNWKDVFDIKWTCFSCNVANLTYAPFCHNLRNYSKHELDRFSANKLNVTVPVFLSCDDLVILVADKEKFCKQLHVSCNIFQEQLT